MKDPALLQRRIMRRDLWVSLWLTRLAGWLEFCGGPRDGAVQRFLIRKITNMATAAMAQILCQAMMHVRPLRVRTFNDPRIRIVESMRAAYGCALRQAFRPVFCATSVKARLECLQRLWAQRGKLALRLIRRLRQGLTRRCFMHTRAPLVEAMGVAMIAPLCANLVAGVDTS